VYLITVAFDKGVHKRRLPDTGPTPNKNNLAAIRRLFNECRDLVKLSVTFENRHRDRC
jgi:hypothetical protein